MINNQNSTKLITNYCRANKSNEFSFVRLLEEADRKAESLEKEGLQNGSSHVNVNMNQGNGVGIRRRPVPRTQDVSNKNVPNLSCLLTQMNPEVKSKRNLK